MSFPSKIFLVTEFLFMATILQLLKVAKRRLSEKVLLERCEVWFSAGRGMNEAENFFFFLTHCLELEYIFMRGLGSLPHGLYDSYIHLLLLC